MSGAMRLRLLHGQDLALPRGPAELWLSPGEAQRGREFSNARRREQFLQGRWLLRMLQADMLDADAAAASLEIDGQGRTLAAPGLHANLSHTGDWLFAAVSDRPVGVDAERLRPRADLAGLAAQVHSPAQCAALAALADEGARLRRFYELWTLKEAWLKCRGSGLDFARMRELDYTVAGPGEPAQAFSRIDEQHGLVLAIDGGAAEPQDGAAWRRWRYA